MNVFVHGPASKTKPELGTIWKAFSQTKRRRRRQEFLMVCRGERAEPVYEPSPVCGNKILLSPAIKHCATIKQNNINDQNTSRSTRDNRRTLCSSLSLNTQNHRRVSSCRNSYKYVVGNKKRRTCVYMCGVLVYQMNCPRNTVYLVNTKHRRRKKSPREKNSILLIYFCKKCTTIELLTWKKNSVFCVTVIKSTI